MWTRESEDALVELWQESKCLYDISSTEYYNRVEKENRWRELADALQMPAEAVITRAASLRTQYSRLMKPKTDGNQKKALTIRQKWILRALDFLKPHIVHRTNETTLDLPVSDHVEETEQDTDEELNESSDGPKVSSSLLLGTSDLLTSEESGSCSPSARSSSGKRKRISETDIEVQKLAILKQMSAKVMENQHLDAAAVFANHVALEYRVLTDPDIQTSVRRKIMNYLYEAQDAERRQSLNIEKAEISDSDCKNYLNT